MEYGREDFIPIPASAEKLDNRYWKGTMSDPGVWGARW